MRRPYQHFIRPDDYQDGEELQSDRWMARQYPDEPDTNDEMLSTAALVYIFAIGIGIVFTIVCLFFAALTAEAH